MPSAPESIEIVRIYQSPGVGNAVKIVWGRKIQHLNLNITYGLHYGTDEENISGMNKSAFEMMTFSKT